MVIVDRCWDHVDHRTVVFVMKRLVHLIDDVEYVNSNCWQHQIRDKLHETFDNVLTVTIADVIRGAWRPAHEDVVFSTLRLRVLDARKQSVSIVLHGHPLIVYDQDPWESYIDQGHCRGAYERIASVINVRSFVNTSKWWAEFVSRQGHNTEFVKMWVKPEYCSCEPVWSKRPVAIGYKGCPRSDRLAAIATLHKLGVDVRVDTVPEPYDVFLSKLSQMRVFFHEESRDSWTISGTHIRRECGWAKDVEIVARGCIALRQHEQESVAYVSDLPAVITYEDINDVPKIVAELERDPMHTDEICTLSVQRVKAQEPWIDLITMLREQ